MRLESGRESEVAQTELIDGLITTYRELNNTVRGLPEERLASPGAGGTGVRDIVSRLRDHELRFSQALKERITGVEMPDFGTGAPVLGTESSHDSTAVLLSQFGTARESTLAMLRGLTDAEWQGTSSEAGTRSIAASVEQLVEHDRHQMEQISGALAGK